MGQQQSKDELLYHQVNYGNIDKSLCSNGASLEWVDKKGKTPLILACMNRELYNVAKTLIQLGANVNAYRPGMDGVDKEKVQRIVYEMSKGSKYFENEQRKEAFIKKKIEHMQAQRAKLTAVNLSHYQKMERTFITIKPDGVQRGLISEIISRFEQKGFKLVGIKILVGPIDAA